MRGSQRPHYVPDDPRRGRIPRPRPLAADPQQPRDTRSAGVAQGAHHRSPDIAALASPQLVERQAHKPGVILHDPPRPSARRAASIQIVGHSPRDHSGNQPIEALLPDLDEHTSSDVARSVSGGRTTPPGVSDGLAPRPAGPCDVSFDIVSLLEHRRNAVGTPGINAGHGN